MAIIEPVKQDLQHPDQIKKYSFPLRLWHWLNAIVITGSLLTVLLNSTLLDRKNNAPFIKETLQKSGAAISDDQANSVAHDLSDKVWEIHTYFGYTLVALLVFRLILEFFQLSDQKLIRGIKNAYQQYFITKKQRELARHELVVKTIYAIFYLLLMIMAVTGLFLAFEDFFEPYKSIRHSVKEVHGFTMYLILGFITIHIVGVLLAERKDSKGIISDMINGG
ncbi:MAG: Ni,Fe-hydrogenase cytochrome b subunit [Mucilaginibacter sp.]|nr:Ni,Fe-hydrogenase cytochrome b subunit [Mucilaginibacter sp.]